LLLLYAKGTQAKHFVGDLDFGGLLTVGEHPVQPVRIGVQLFKTSIAKSNNLCNEAIKSLIAPKKLPKLLLSSFVVIRLEAQDSRTGPWFQRHPVLRRQRSFEERHRKSLDFVIVEVTQCTNARLQLVDLILVGNCFQAGYFVVVAERFLDVIHRVLEVENK